jgi:CBS domain-containing protein
MNKVRHLLQYKPAGVSVISPYAAVYEALELLAEKDIGALPVLQEGKLVGMFSERDYARRCILNGRHSKNTRVLELMSSPVVTIDPGATIDDCLKMMTVRKLRHLPVVEAGRLIGIVTIGDIVKWIITQQQMTIKDLEGFITGHNYAH